MVKIWTSLMTNNRNIKFAKASIEDRAGILGYVGTVWTHINHPCLGTGLGNVSASLVSFAASLRFDKTPCRSWKSSARYPPWQHEWLRTRKIQLILTDCVTTVIHSQEAIHRIPEESWILKALCEKMSTYWHGCDWDSQKSTTHGTMIQENRIKRIYPWFTKRKEHVEVHKLDVIWLVLFKHWAALHKKSRWVKHVEPEVQQTTVSLSYLHCKVSLPLWIEHSLYPDELLVVLRYIFAESIAANTYKIARSSMSRKFVNW